MALAVGIDSVDISRFANWVEYPQKKLLRVFCQEEIDYCLSVPTKSAERFAGRFASKEALFKAFCQKNPHKPVPFLTFCRAVAVLPSAHGPQVRATNALPDQNIDAVVSITHTAQVCTAIALMP